MKSPLALTTATLCCIGSFMIGFCSPIQADTSESQPTTSPSILNEEWSDPHSTSQGQAELLLVEPMGFDVTTDADADALDTVANQINQVIESDSEEFLPEGMVIRGSAGSLQVGSEL